MYSKSTVNDIDIFYLKKITYSFLKQAHFLVKCSICSLEAFSTCFSLAASSPLFSRNSFSRSSASLGKLVRDRDIEYSII